jgi:hypothetical protein
VRDPRFRDLVAELAAPLRGIAKDELIGEDIRQHRRLNRWRNAAFGVVTMLLIGAVAAAVIAVQQRQTAIAQRDQAQRNESRALAALANIEADSGSPATTVRVALAALPRSLAGMGRPYVLEAESTLHRTFAQLRELRHIGLMITYSLPPSAPMAVPSLPAPRWRGCGRWRRAARSPH